ncbi:FecR domain-containing protein [Stenotrophomonas rhizophila]
MLRLPLAVRALALVVLLLSAAPLLAQDWTYRVRPGDTIWDLSARYLKPSIAWEQLQSHNGIADPYRLPPGSQLRFPVAWLQVQPAPARVLAVRGPVHSQTDGQPRREVAEGDLLRIGQELFTGDDASVTVVFADDSRLQLREQSRLRFDQLSRYGRTGMVDTRLRLEQGRASNRVTPANGPASRYIIDAPTATSSVRGTVFRVSAGRDGVARPPRYWKAACRSATAAASVWSPTARPRAARRATRARPIWKRCCQHPC